MTDKTHLLSKDPRQAVEEMIKITQELESKIETETNALGTNDGTTFATNEENKEYLANMYEQAASEFRARLEEFHQVDQSLLDKLQTAQDSLGHSTKNNLAMLAKMQDSTKP